MIEAGDIILLTRRKLDWKLHRYILSLLIHILTGKYTHSAIVYKRYDGLYIREMEWDGVRINQSLTSYIEEYNNRIYYMKPIKKLTFNERTVLDNLCMFEHYKYEYKQLIWQLVKSLTGKFIGKKTKFKRNCSEDTARLYNLIRPNTFKNQEQITPMEISKSKLFNILKLE